MTVGAAPRSLISAVNKTTFQVGTYTASNDTFTKVLDLNDHASYWIDTVELPQPEKVYSRGSTIRSPGERISAWQYKNRHIKVTLNLLYQANTAALLASLRALIDAVENPPYRIAFAAPGSTVLTYADVVAVAHTIPYDPKQILSGALVKITIDFECLPGLLGDRIFLSNLLYNPGFEAPSGPAVNVFYDNFANTNAYTLRGGTAPSVTSSLMTIPNGTTVTFGSPSWSAVNVWKVRFQYTAIGALFRYFLHYVDGANWLACQIFSGGGGFSLQHCVAGTQHQIAVAGPTLTAGNFYWFQITQFPSPPNLTPMVQATVYNDSAGAVGSSVAAIGPAPTYDGVTALTGVSGMFASSNSIAVGGAFSNVHTVNLFGPGGWTTNDSGAGITAYGWEQSSNRYQNGPFMSYCAARMDFAPAGAITSAWRSGNPAGTGESMRATCAPVAAAGDQIAASVWLKTSGITSSTFAIFLQLNEYDTSGTFLRQTNASASHGALPGYTQLANTFTTGTSCAYVMLSVVATDTAGAGSNGGTLWIDNAQLWDVTSTGQTTMPYCELRFPQAPVQLQLSGLQGDMPAPALMSYGFYTPAGYTYGSGYTTLALTVGQRATPHYAGDLISLASLGTTVTGSTAAILDATVYGGYYVEDTNTSSNNYSYSFPALESTLIGLYHAMILVKPVDTHYSTQTVAPFLAETLSVTLGATVYGEYTAPSLPLGMSAAIWKNMDVGQMAVPFAPIAARESLSGKYVYVGANFMTGAVPSSATPIQMGPTVFMPVDGGCSVVALGATVPSVSQWTWVYNEPTSAADAAGGAQAAFAGGAAWRYSLENAPLPNFNHASGGPGASSYVPTQPLADPYLRLDPTNGAGQDGTSIAEMAATLNDSAYGYNYALACEVAYTPQYLYPRAS